MKKKMTLICTVLAIVLSCSILSSCTPQENQDNSLIAKYTFDEGSGSVVMEQVSGKNITVENAFSAENQDSLFKPSSDLQWRKGVKGNALYMDGYSNYIKDTDFRNINDDFTLSAFVAPRVFENTHDGKLTAVIGKGNVTLGEGFVFGYERLGRWGIKMALVNPDDDLDVAIVEFFDPNNKLAMYEWNHIAVSYNHKNARISLYLNGHVAAQTILSKYAGWTVVPSRENLMIGRYVDPSDFYGFKGNTVAGLLDEVEIHDIELNAQSISNIYSTVESVVLNYDDIKLNESIYDGDRYRPQYHAIPAGLWMNEPHAPIYFNGKFHLFFQHNPSGPYWAQIRWGHWVSDDMINWVQVKDAVVPVSGVAPEGIWTGGAVIGPDGVPWLVVTVGTNTANGSGQNIGYARPSDPTDPNLTDWVLEDKVALAQQNGWGVVNQFRDPFIWKDGDTYYLLVSSSRGPGGTANIFTSNNMRDWTRHGFLFEPSYELYPEIGVNWECTVLLPVKSKDGSITKYALFITPQYASSSQTVECYYWIGDFNKETKRFVPDSPHLSPRLLDLGNGIFTGQTGFSYLPSDAPIDSTYEDGRSILFTIAQGKEMGSTHDYYSGWAHNAGMPIELYLSNEGDLRYSAINELENYRNESLFSQTETLSVDAINEQISNIRGDMLDISFTMNVSNVESVFETGIYLRYNPASNEEIKEMTKLVLNESGMLIDRSVASRYQTLKNSHTASCGAGSYDIRILLDRSMLEVYVNDTFSFTSRVYPKYSNSDYIKFFASNADVSISNLKVYNMKTKMGVSPTQPYYSNSTQLG